MLDGNVSIDVAAHYAARLRALLADDPRQLPRIDIGDSYDAGLFEEVTQRPLGAPATTDHGTVANDQPGRVCLRRLHIFAVGARIADMRVCQGDDLAAIGRIGEDFLIAGHRRIEDDFTNGLAIGPDRGAPKDGSVGKCQNSRRTQQRSSISVFTDCRCTKAEGQCLPLVISLTA